MAQFQFFATRLDIVALIGRILADTDLRVLEMYSEGEEPIREYKTLDEFEAEYPPVPGSPGFGQRPLLTLWSPSVLKRRPVRRYDVSSDESNGCRYAYEALDESAFYLKPGDASEMWIEKSVILHNSALRKEGVRDWKRFNVVLRLLRKIVLKELAVAVVVERCAGVSPSIVMQGALKLHQLNSVSLKQFRNSPDSYSIQGGAA